MRGDDSFCLVWVERVRVLVDPSLRNVKCGVDFDGALGIVLGDETFRVRHDERETLADERK